MGLRIMGIKCKVASVAPGAAWNKLEIPVQFLRD